MESNLTPKISRSSDSFSIVPPIVNGGDWGCIVNDLETIIVLVWELVHGNSHFRMGTARVKLNKETEEEFKQKRVTMEISTVVTKKTFPDDIL